MEKKLSVISRIKNRIFSFIYRLKGKNTEPGVTEEKEQPVDSEPISRSENKMETHSPDKKELIDLKKELGESIDAILNKLFDGISGLLEDEYKDRLIGLERSIEELKKEKIEQVAPDLKEELEEVRNLAETAKLSSEENIGKIAKITKQALNEEDIKKITTIIEKMKREGKDRLSEDEIEKIYLNKAVITLISAEARELPNLSLDSGKPSKESVADTINKLDEMRINSMMPGKLKELENMPEELKELENMPEELKELKIESLYKKGIELLKSRAYQEAKECFNGITSMNSELKGAWLNSGVAFGESGEIEDEIDCYNIALRIDEKYKKAQHNKKIAERKLKRTK